MLTKTDLKEIDKIIQKRVREEVEAEGKNIKDGLGTDIRTSRMRIQEDIRELSSRVKNIEITIGRLEKTTQTVEKDIAVIKKDLQRIEKKIDKSVDFIDREYLELKKRVERIEKHLKLEPLSA